MATDACMPITDVDMPFELRRALRAAAVEDDSAEFLHTMNRLIASVDDGHGIVSQPGALIYTAPLIWRRIEDQVIVVRVKDD